MNGLGDETIMTLTDTSWRLARKLKAGQVFKAEPHTFLNCGENQTATGLYVASWPAHYDRKTRHTRVVARPCLTMEAANAAYEKCGGPIKATKVRIRG